MWKPGNCYHNAFRWLLYRPELSEDHYIVHGLVYHEQSGRHGHAWIETTIDGIQFVYDSGDYIPKVLYYLWGDVSYTVRYTLKEAATLACQTEHSGPWDYKILNIGEHEVCNDIRKEEGEESQCFNQLQRN